MNSSTGGRFLAVTVLTAPLLLLSAVPASADHDGTVGPHPAPAASPATPAVPASDGSPATPAIPASPATPDGQPTALPTAASDNANPPGLTDPAIAETAPVVPVAAPTPVPPKKPAPAPVNKPVNKPKVDKPKVDNSNKNGRVTICHSTHSAENPYVLKTLSKNGAMNGHAKHHDGRDIIPSFTYVQHGELHTFAGQGDQSLLANGCKVGSGAAVNGGVGGNASPADVLGTRTEKLGSGAVAGAQITTLPRTGFPTPLVALLAALTVALGAVMTRAGTVRV